MNARQTILVVVAVLLVGGLAVWWYFGFSLGFMRFFAADPSATDQAINPSCTAPAGCTCQVVQCIQAPCDPIIVCPSCRMRPACLDAVPSCDIAEPADGWCPVPTKTCQSRPACLDLKPIGCTMAEPADGWCPSPAPAPGGRIVSCSPATQTVAVGANANLTAGGGAAPYTWFAPDGVMNNPGPNDDAVPNTVSVKYNTQGIKKVTVQSARGDGSKNIDSVACTVTVTP